MGAAGIDVHTQQEGRERKSTQHIGYATLRNNKMCKYCGIEEKVCLFCRRVSAPVAYSEVHTFQPFLESRAKYTVQRVHVQTISDSIRVPRSGGGEDEAGGGVRRESWRKSLSV